jgi:two-component system phosphate regulon sensor histidine kinase PhoR
MAPNRPGKMIRRTALASAPGLLVILGLTLGGWLPVKTGAVCIILVFLLAALLFWQHLRDLDRLQRRIEQIGQTGADPRLPTPSHPNLSTAVNRLAAAWQRRMGELETESRIANNVLDGLPDPLILVAGSRQVIRANKAAADLTDRRLTGADLATGIRHPSLLEAVERVLGGGPGETVEINLPVPIERTYTARIEPIEGAAGAAAALLMFHDLTAIRAGERMRVDFIANVSHELRTPLASLIGFIETLRGPAREDTDAHDKFLSIMNDQAERMARLIEDLLSLSKIEMDEHTLPQDRVSLPPILAKVEDMLTMKARDRNMKIDIKVMPNLAPVLGDADQLTQVFQNLVDNAIKYGRADTKVTVHARPNANGGIAVSVQDQGEGIPPEQLPRLTERFYRVDTARSRELGGTGLGLAIVKHIVNRHRGTLDIDSEFGNGSTFTVTLRNANR